MMTRKKNQTTMFILKKKKSFSRISASQALVWKPVANMAERKEWQNGGSRSWPHNVPTRSFPLWEASMSCAYLINDPRWVELQLSTNSVLGDCFASQRPQLSSEIFFCGRRIWATTINGRWPLTFASKQSRAWSPSQPLLQWALLDPVYYDMPQRLTSHTEQYFHEI